MDARKLRLVLAGALTAALLAACSRFVLPPDAFVVGGEERPAVVVPPPDHDPAVPTPLLVMLHGYRSSAARVERIFPFGSGAAVAGVIVVRPQGTRDTAGQRYWNAAEACCDLLDRDVDDEQYLLSVIDEIADTVAVSEVALFGHSNGAFMAYTLACSNPARFAAVVTVAGALDDPPPDCGADGPPRVLHIHGTNDGIINYAGGSILGQPPYTGAAATVAVFADGAGCGPLAEGTPFDLDTRVPGDETMPLVADCPEGRRLVHWRIDGGPHEPAVRENFAARVLAFAFGE
ncbi:MAG: alpha/beta hydrolase family esterase [Trueperaceae bacterium]